MPTGFNAAQELLGDKKCDLCDTYNQVIWKCQNCQEVLCEKCKNIHLRSRLSKNHIVTEIADESSGDGQHSSVFCPDHSNEALQMFCTTCDCLICLDCITGKHTKHQYLKLGEILLQKQEELEAAFDEIRNMKIPSLEQTIDFITGIQDDYSQKIDRLLKDIKSKGEELRQEIGKIERKLTNEVMKRAIQNQKQLSETKEKCEQQLSLMKTYLTEHEEKVHKLTDIDIILKTSDIKEMLSHLTHELILPKVSMAKFLSTQHKVEQLEQMYGQLLCDEVESLDVISRTKSTTLTASSGLREITPQDTQTTEIISSFKNEKSVFRMKMLNQDEAWVVDRNGVLKLIDQKGKILKTLSTELDISDMAITSAGDFLVTVKGGKDIKHVKTGSGDVVTFADMTPYTTYGLHITDNEDVLVGLHHPSKSVKITRLSPKGKTKHDVNVTNKELILPMRITENKNGDIVITDSWKTIVVIDKKNQYRISYTGPKQSRRFYPQDVVCNTNEEILVADGNGNNIQVLNKDGVFMRYILTQQEGLSTPTALTIDKNGKLWISCYDGKIFVVKYLI